MYRGIRHVDQRCYSSRYLSMWRCYNTCPSFGAVCVRDQSISTPHVYHPSSSLWLGGDTAGVLRLDSRVQEARCSPPIKFKSLNWLRQHRPRQTVGQTQRVAGKRTVVCCWSQAGARTAIHCQTHTSSKQADSCLLQVTSGRTDSYPPPDAHFNNPESSQPPTLHQDGSQPETASSPTSRAVMV